MPRGGLKLIEIAKGTVQQVFSLVFLHHNSVDFIVSPFTCLSRVSSKQAESPDVKDGRPRAGVGIDQASGR